MEVFNKVAKMPVFSIVDVEELMGNLKTAYSQLDRWTKKGKVKKIRNNIYSAINPATGQIVANRYQIACAITKTAYLSHHSAFEYYGLANQVFYEMYVSSNMRFNHFEYDQISYRYIVSKTLEGVIEATNTEGVRLTNLERTVIDSIKDVNRIGGLEELLKCLENIDYLEEDKLIKYLDLYDIKSLYQKTGFILKNYQKEMQISDSFIKYCLGKIGNSIQYLEKDSKDNYYNRQWKLMIPEGLFNDSV